MFSLHLQFVRQLWPIKRVLDFTHAPKVVPQVPQGVRMGVELASGSAGVVCPDFGTLIIWEQGMPNCGEAIELVCALRRGEQRQRPTVTIPNVRLWRILLVLDAALGVLPDASASRHH